MRLASVPYMPIIGQPISSPSNRRSALLTSSLTHAYSSNRSPLFIYSLHKANLNCATSTQLLDRRAYAGVAA